MPASTIVEYLPDHPTVDPGRVDPSWRLWLVIRTPGWLARRLLGRPTLTLVVQSRPGTVDVLFPTGRPAPDWAVTAIEYAQVGLEEHPAHPSDELESLRAEVTRLKEDAAGYRARLLR